MLESGGTFCSCAQAVCLANNLSTWAICAATLGSLVAKLSFVAKMDFHPTCCVHTTAPSHGTQRGGKTDVTVLFKA